MHQTSRKSKKTVNGFASSLINKAKSKPMFGRSSSANSSESFSNLKTVLEPPDEGKDEGNNGEINSAFVDMKDDENNA